MASQCVTGAERAPNQRRVLKAGLAASVAFPYIATSIAQDLWRTFELHMTMDLHFGDRASQLWLPLPRAVSYALGRVQVSEIG
jgi:hypothetical protein